MSGEYYAIEEVCDPEIYYNESQPKVDTSATSFYRENDTVSIASKRSQENRLHEIEEQLQFAENRCNTLKGQLDLMKQNYHKTGKADSPRFTRKVNALNHRSLTDNIAERKKRPCSPKFKSNSIRAASPTKSSQQYDNFISSTAESFTRHSSNSSFDGIPDISIGAGDAFPNPPIRQASKCISTDTSGSAAQTINNILMGITESFNQSPSIQRIRDGRISRHKSRSRSAINNSGAVYELPKQLCSPRVEKRLIEQQKKIEEIAKCNVVLPQPDEKKQSPEKESITNVKSKLLGDIAWERNAPVKKFKGKNKKHSSSDSISVKAHVKSTAKHVEKTTKIQPVRTGMLDEGSQLAVSTKKRKRPTKRLKQLSKVSLGRKSSENNSRKRFEQYTTDNLVELYHNVAAKESDSDNSKCGNKTQSNKQKDSSNVVPAPVRPTTADCNITEKVDVESKNKIFGNSEPPAPRALSPIEEHRSPERLTAHSECYSNHIPKNYELPTISSSLKQATKCYMNSFDFCAIPFCAAKSTSPSHNIGINIQQVMSLIKSRRPVTGISPTLAHNLTVAAGKISTHPLKGFVSTLSSKIGFGRPVCPLSKFPINFHHLQEIAKEIPEEPEEEYCDCTEEAVTDATIKSEPYANGPSGDTQASNPVPTWMTSSGPEERCTCIPQKGVPFQQVLNKYHIRSYPERTVYYNEKNSLYKNRNSVHGGRCQLFGDRILSYADRISRCSKSQRQTKPFNQTPQKPRPGLVAKNNRNITDTLVKKKSEAKVLEGKEKNLKMVLNNLHDEFDSLNTRYEELVKDINGSQIEPSQETVKQLEEMEAQLNKKEEEINMVMSLYTEVLALKNQVKKLREKTSQASLSTAQVRPKMAETNPTQHLTQLLRQIQNYQEVCKNRKN